MRLIDADALKEAVTNNPLIDFTDDDIFKLIDNAPTVTDRTEEVLSLQNTIAKLVEGISENARPQGDFTRKELVSWLWTIAINNTENELGRSCKEIIHRLDGFERYVSDIREEAAGGNHD